jgi:hypothetical protein
MRLLLVVVLSATMSAPVVAQSKRTSFAGENAIRVSYGRAFPVGSENLAHAWSAGPSFAGSWEHFLSDASLHNDMSVGIMFERSSHPFDAVGFMKDIHPGGNSATSASGQTATVTNIGGFGRFVGQPRRAVPFMLVGLGFFNTNRGDVLYGSPTGSGTLTMGSKSGVYVGISLGVDITLGNSALSLESGWALGASKKDEEENVNYVVCYNGSGCSTPKKQTQLLTIRAGVRHILPRTKSGAR